MSALPPSAIVIAPNIAGVAMSFANLAWAEGQHNINDAAKHLAASVKGLSKTISDINARGAALDKLFFNEAPDSLREDLEAFFSFEKGILEIHQNLSHALQAKKFPSGLAAQAAKRIHREIPSVYLPFLRTMRWRIVSAIWEKLRAEGIELPELEESQRIAFMDARLDDTLGWQETAHILANPVNARRVLKSIRSPTTDRSTEVSVRTERPAP